MTTETPIAQWLRREMPAHGYPLTGPRPGGISRLAKEIGVSHSTMSRLVNGAGEPSIDSLRRIGRQLGYSLSQMLLAAGLATPEDLEASPAATDTRTTARYSRPPGDYTGTEDWDDLDATLRAVWYLPDLSADQRHQVHHFVAAIKQTVSRADRRQPRRRGAS